jgi:hypothetical protein
MLKTSIPWWLRIEMGVEGLPVEEGFSRLPLSNMLRGIPAEVEAESNGKPKRTPKVREPAAVTQT